MHSQLAQYEQGLGVRDVMEKLRKLKGQVRACVCEKWPKDTSPWLATLHAHVSCRTHVFVAFLILILNS